MAYLNIDDFKNGLDRRRDRVTGIPGSLWLGRNVHITRGGDVERRKRFSPRYTLPANTFGLAAVTGQLFVFGSATAPTMPVGVQYQRLQAPDSSDMTRVLDWKVYDRKLYVVAEYATGAIYHFYNGSRVTDWDAIAQAGFTHEGVARELENKINNSSVVTALASAKVVTITANVPGVDFTATKATTNSGTGGATNDQDITLATAQANVVEVAEVLSSADIEITGGSDGSITSITVGSDELLASAVAWSATNEATAIQVTQSINNASTTSGYSASVAGAVVTVSAAPGTGATPNTLAVEVTKTGDVTVTADAELAGGVTYVAPVAKVVTATLSGTVAAEDANDTFTITIDGTAYIVSGMAPATGKSVFVYKERIWSVAESLLRYCKLAAPTVWNPATEGSDAGFINISVQNAGSSDLIAVAEFQSSVAIFGRDFITIFDLDTDPLNNALVRTLPNTGTRALGSVVSYGSNDVFYYDETGIRSLRARDSSSAASVSDVGTAIDTYLQEYARSVPTEQSRQAVSVIEPKDGRYMQAIGDRVFVFSFFPGSKISAWSDYVVDEVEGGVSAFLRVNNLLYARVGDTICLYGGVSGEEYPEQDEGEPEVALPFLTAGKPATFKGFTGYDIACSNLWLVEFLVDPNDETAIVTGGRASDVTYTKDRQPSLGLSTHIAPRFTCTKPGAAKISSFALHYDEAEAG
jgi:hypothetical protein